MKEFYAKKKLFGKEIEIIIKDVEPIFLKPILKEVYDYGLKLQKIFNLFDKNSELSKLNKKRKLIISDELLSVIKKALKLCKLTEGKYDITLGKKILQRKKRIQEKPVRCSYKDVIIKGNKVSLINKDVILDLGSIAKGYITDKMVERFISKGILSGLINARGDIRCFGKNPFYINIQHPRKKNEIIHMIKLKNSSVATSGDYKQYFGKHKKNHIINSEDVISLTVVAPTLEEADAYATLLFVLRKKEREKIIKKNKKIKVLVINSNFKRDYYNNFKNLIIKNRK